MVFSILPQNYEEKANIYYPYSPPLTGQMSILAYFIFLRKWIESILCQQEEKSQKSIIGDRPLFSPDRLPKMDIFPKQ